MRRMELAIMRHLQMSTTVLCIGAIITQMTDTITRNTLERFIPDTPDPDCHSLTNLITVTPSMTALP